MVKETYERFGLTGNPFRDLASETIDLVDIFHVDQEIDEELKGILDEIGDKENKATIAILGGLGVGKTQRLMLISNYAKKKGYFKILRTMTPDTRWAVKGIVDAIIKSAPLNAFEKYVNAPRWFVEMKNISRRLMKGKGHDPVTTGKLIADSLNSKSPSFLLINDLQAIPISRELSDFMQTLYVVINNIDNGVLVAISSNNYFFDDLMKQNEAFNQRINRKFNISSLTATQAEHLIAKRLIARRLTEDLGLVYPFTTESVEIINDEVKGNPRQILKIADTIMDSASKSKTIEIGREYVIEFMRSRKGNELLPPAPSDIENELKARYVIDSSSQSYKKMTEDEKRTYTKSNKVEMDHNEEMSPIHDHINEQQKEKKDECEDKGQLDDQTRKTDYNTIAMEKASKDQKTLPGSNETDNQKTIFKEETVYKQDTGLNLADVPKPPVSRYNFIEQDIKD